MPLLPISNSSLLVRVDEGRDGAWHRLVEIVETETPDGFRAYVEFIDDPQWHECTPEQLRAALPDHSMELSVLFVADRQALATDDFPILVVDLIESRCEFRCVASELHSVENNLNIANMDWEEFEAATDAHRVFRGFA